MLIDQQAAAERNACRGVGLHRTDQTRDHAWFAVVIAIGKNDELTRRHFNTLVAYCYPAAVLLTDDQINLGMRLILAQYLNAIVCGTVIYGQNLHILVGLGN